MLNEDPSKLLLVILGRRKLATGVRGCLNTTHNVGVVPVPTVVPPGDVPAFSHLACGDSMCKFPGKQLFTVRWLSRSSIIAFAH